MADKKASAKAPLKASAKAPATKTSAKISVKQQPAKRQSPVAVGGVTLRCRDCLAQVDYNPSSDAEFLECPLCGHRAGKPSEDQLSQAAMYKAIEGRKAKVAVVLAFISAALFTAWIVLGKTPEVLVEQNALYHYGPLGGGIVFAIIAMVAGINHEGSRWEAFF